MPGFAVIDLETTGLFPSGHDRIVEIAVVHTDEWGRETGRWETLVNPDRDLGPQHIHGIRAADLVDAPRFDQLVPTLVELLQGRVLVAHNASFDSRFLFAELERAGYDLWQVPEFLCTMSLARDFLPGSGRSLADCCDAFDIELANAHRALYDTVATAQLLESYIRISEGHELWTEAHEAAAGFDWPTPASSERVSAKPRPAFTVDTTVATFLKRITEKLPEYGGPLECNDYLALLDRALLDRYISVHEANGLVSMAENLGISRTTIEALHLEYFDALVTIAWADGELTEEELADIVAVGDLLDLPMPVIDEAVDARRWFAAHPRPAVAEHSIDSFRLSPGDLIVLTGEMTRPRADIELDLIAGGYVPWASVTKKVRLVAAADPDSFSGKAKKARDYGIPVVGEAALMGML